jgi:nucleoside-diphosphate-sugar epimerase
MCAAEREEAAGHVFNISGGVPLPARTIVERVCEALGQRPRLVSLPISVAMAAAGMAELVARLRGTEPSITRYSVMTLAWSQTFDLSAARETLGWRPTIHPFDAIAHALDGR